MPTKKELADDDPELLDLMKGGGLQAGTIREGEEQGREQQLAVITASSQLTRCETNIDHIHDFSLLSGIISEYSSSAWPR